MFRGRPRDKGKEFNQLERTICKMLCAETERLGNCEMMQSDTDFIFKIKSYSLRFKKDDSPVFIDSRAWFESVVKQGGLHEPGLVAAHFFLKNNVQKSIQYFDIGSCFGYYAVLAREVFCNCRVVAVEGNPFVAKALRKIVSGQDIKIQQSYLGEVSGSWTYVVRGWASYRKSHIQRGLQEIIYVVKATFNSIGKFVGLHRTNPSVEIVISDEMSIPDLLHGCSHAESQIILKLDTEGYHIHFLNRHYSTLAKMNAILLLEQDSLWQMLLRGGSNKRVFDSLVQVGYCCFWVDHRRPKGFEVVEDFKIKYNRNSLLICIPKSILNSFTFVGVDHDSQATA